MKKLIWSLVCPLTFVSYCIFDKWWFARVIDGPTEFLYGFPLINRSPSLASSMEMNYYVFETIFNITSYFAFWLLLTFLINSFIVKLKIPEIVAKLFFVLVSVYVGLFIYYLVSIHTTFYFKRDIGIKQIEQGFKWVWQANPEPKW
jgi:hypothetical protein